MRPYREPEPKPIFIALCGLAGAAAGLVAGLTIRAIDPHLHVFITFSPVDPFKHIHFIVAAFAGLGLGVGVGSAVSSRLWIKLLAGPAIVVMAMLVASQAIGLMEGHPMVSGVPRPLEPSLWIGVPMALVMILANHFFVQAREKRRASVVALFAYANLGAVAILPFCYLQEWPKPLIAMVWIGGAIFGAFQCLAMVASLAIDRKFPHSTETEVVSARPMMITLGLACVIGLAMLSVGVYYWPYSVRVENAKFEYRMDGGYILVFQGANLKPVDLYLPQIILRDVEPGSYRYEYKIDLEISAGGRNLYLLRESAERRLPLCIYRLCER